MGAIVHKLMRWLGPCGAGTIFYKMAAATCAHPARGKTDCRKKLRGGRIQLAMAKGKMQLRQVRIELTTLGL